MIEKISRQEWLDRNPITLRYIEENPTDWRQISTFNMWPDPDDIDGISDHQREKLHSALSARLAILGGSPGTGKTYAVAKLIKHMLDEGIIPDYEIGIGAPTGKAAVRLTENLQKNGLDLCARTWHSLLGIDHNSETGGWKFAHDEDSPLPYRILIGDESSMLDLSLMLAIFRARAPGSHFLLVGDVNQLPPVGAGAPLRDMIAAGIPYGELTEIKRNSGGIVEACAAIRDTKPWRQFTQEKESNLRLHEVGNADRQISKAIDLIMETKSRGLDPIWDCQVLVAVNERSQLSRAALNKLLQEELNPGEKLKNTSFRVNDKVVCLKNGFYRSLTSVHQDAQRNDKGEVYVANGELAEVVEIQPNCFIVELELPARKVSVPLFKQESEDGSESESGAAMNWDLGYALSVHKSQGSEWDTVIVMLDSYAGARQICDRSWIYTAISRARNKCHLVGSYDLAERFCRVQKIGQRKTFLREQIGLKMLEKSGV